jgi:hypothetical protein
VNSGAREGYAVPASYKTPAVLLIYTVNSGKSFGSDRGKKTSTPFHISKIHFDIFIHSYAPSIATGFPMHSIFL